jgi:hypothetical protein
MRSAPLKTIEADRIDEKVIYSPLFPWHGNLTSELGEVTVANGVDETTCLRRKCNATHIFVQGRRACLQLSFH